MITIVPTLFSTPSNDNTAPGADQTADLAKNFFPLLFALFPAGMTQSQLSQSPSASEPSPSTRLFQSQMATHSSSLVDSSEEKTAREVIGATSGKGDGTTNNTLSDPNLLLSLLLPFLSGQIPPLTNPVQPAQITTQEGQASSQSMQDVSPLFAEQSVSMTDAESTGVSTSNAEPTSVSTTDAEPIATFSQPAVDTTLKDVPGERGIGEQGFPVSPKNGNQAGERPESRSLGALEKGDALGQPTLPQATARPIFPTAPVGGTTPVETKANTLAKGALNPYDSEERKEGITYSGQAPIGLQEPQAKALDYPAQIPTPGLELGASFGGMSQARLLQQGQTSGLPVGERNQADVPVTLQETTPTSAKPTVAVADLVLSESNPTASPSTERLIVEGPARGKGSPSVPNAQKLVTEAESLTTKSTGVPSLSVSQLQPEKPLGPRNNLESWQPVVNQVAERIVANVKEESREARLQLDPPELGRLDIQLVVEGSHIRAHIVAGSADVGALIQTHLPELKHALQEHRLDLDTVRVDVQSDDGGCDTSSRNFQQDGRTSGRGSNLGSSSIVEEKESPPVLSPVHARGRVSVWA